MKQVKEAKNSGGVAVSSPRPAQERIFQSQREPKPSESWRVTMVVEARSAEMFEWGMEQAFDLGRALFIGVEVSHKDDPTARVKVRTTKLRKPKLNAPERDAETMAAR